MTRHTLVLFTAILACLAPSCQSGRYVPGTVQRARITVKMAEKMNWPAPPSVTRDVLVPLTAGVAGAMVGAGGGTGMAGYGAGVAIASSRSGANSVENAELHDWFKSELLRHLKTEIEARRQFQIVTDASAEAEIAVDVKFWGFGSNINIKFKEEIGCGSWAILIMKSPEGKLLWSTITKPMTWNFDSRMIKRSRQEYAANPNLVKQDLSAIAQTVAREAASSLPVGPPKRPISAPAHE